MSYTAKDTLISKAFLGKVLTLDKSPSASVDFSLVGGEGRVDQVGSGVAIVNNTSLNAGPYTITKIDARPMDYKTFNENVLKYEPLLEGNVSGYLDSAFQPEKLENGEAVKSSGYGFGINRGSRGRSSDVGFSSNIQLEYNVLGQFGVGPIYSGNLTKVLFGFENIVSKTIALSE